MNKVDRTVEIFSGTIWEAELVKSLLTDFEIASFIKHNLITSYALEPIQSENVKVMILEKDLPPAKKIVDDFYSNQQQKP